MSAEVFQQREPFATSGFCLLIQKMLQQNRSKFKSGYLDDVVYGDTWQTALKDLIDLESCGKDVGVLLIQKNCENTAFGPNEQAIYHEFLKVF